MSCPKCGSAIYLNLSMTFECGSIGSRRGDYLVRRTTLCMATELADLKAQLATACEYTALLETAARSVVKPCLEYLDHYSETYAACKRLEDVLNTRKETVK